MNLEQVIQRSTRALQPLATAVPTGTIYFVTDESVLERSNGAAWESYSSAAGSGITQLTGDVTAGPGSGSQVATVATLVGDSGAGGTKGLVPAPAAGDAAASKFLKADATWAAPASSGEWTTIITKAADQDVENSTVFVDDTELILAVTAESVWIIELLIAYSGTNAADDYKWETTVTAGVQRGIVRYSGLNAANAAQNTAQGINSVATSPAIPQGVEAGIGNLSVFIAEFFCKFTANANFKFRFAQNAAGGAGTFARTKAGSILRGKRLI